MAGDVLRDDSAEAARDGDAPLRRQARGYRKRRDLAGRVHPAQSKPATGPSTARSRALSLLHSEALEPAIQTLSLCAAGHGTLPQDAPQSVEHPMTRVE